MSLAAETPVAETSFAETPAAPAPGAVMAREIAEQPSVLAGILDEGSGPIRAVAAEILKHDPRFVLFTGRGTSDNAGLYARYLTEILLGRPAGLTSMSTTTAYHARQRLEGALVVTVSQSGGSPDLIASARQARADGALTLAVTNNAESPLARESDLHLDVLAGPELALPATKTYTAELLTLYLLVDALRGGTGEAARELPRLASAVLDRAGETEALAERYRFAQRLVLTGRGYGYPTVREAALKIMETCYLPAQPFSGADLMHGPLAMIDESCPVLAVSSEGVAGAALRPVLERLRERGADLCVVGSAEAVTEFGRGFVLPSPVAEELSPILEILPFQMLTRSLALARGGNPDSPRGLAKVTETH